MRIKPLITILFVTVVLSSCVKDPSIPAGQTFSSNAFVMVTTGAYMSNITQTSAEGWGDVDVFGNTVVTERGICWSISHNPTIEDSHAASGSGKGSFYCNITGLSAGTTYYYRAYAINSKGVTYGEEESFTTQPSDGEFTITVSADPSDGGIVYGGGNYNNNQTCTLAAIANEGYIFVDWKDYGGSIVSNNANYSFTVNGNRILIAEFMANPQSYTISVSANPIDGGIVAGSGVYQGGQSRTVYATANSGYTFTNWTENGVQVSSNDSYSFIVDGNRTLVANFESTNVTPQSFRFEWNGHAYSDGEIIECTNDEYGYGEYIQHMQLRNLTSYELNIVVEKEVIGDLEGTMNFFCWGSCFGPDVFVSPNPVPLAGNTITNDQALSFHTMFDEDVFGTVIIKYYAYDTYYPDERLCIIIRFIR